MVGGRPNFIIFVADNGTMVYVGRPFLFNVDYARIMVTAKIGKHTVEMYDAIEELPIIRFHKYQKLLLIDSGIGSDISGFDQHVEKARRFCMAKKPEQALQELANLRQCVYMIQNEISPKHLSLAALITKIDGREYNDLSDDGLAKIIATLNDATEKELTDQLDSVKKKIDGELVLFFPRLFVDSDVKEYYDMLRKRALEILNNIVAGIPVPDETQTVIEMTTALITYSNPKDYAGSDGAEIQFERNFENLCIMLSQELNVKPKKYSVLEFYNAFEFLQNRAKAAEMRQNGAKTGR